jgi:hypothetical protein
MEAVDRAFVLWRWEIASRALYAEGIKIVGYVRRHVENFCEGRQLHIERRATVKISGRKSDREDWREGERRRRIVPGRATEKIGKRERDRKD